MIEGGDRIATTGDGAALLVYNGSGASINVTVHITKTVDGVPIAGTRVTAVAAGAHEVIPLPAGIGDANDQVTFDLSATTSAGVAAFRIG